MNQRTPAPPAARPFLRSRNGLLTALGAAVVVVVLAVIVLRALTPPPPPPNPAEKVAQQFYTAIQHQDYTTAWGLLDDEQKALLTQYAFTLFATQQDQKYGAVTSFHEVRYDADRNHANQGVVQERVTRANHTQYLIGLTITKDTDGTWKILEEDHAI